MRTDSLFAVQIVDRDGNVLCHAQLTPGVTMSTGDTLSISLHMGEDALLMVPDDEVDHGFRELVSSRQLVHGLNQS